MQALIYAGLRNGPRDQMIHDALIYKRVAEVAEEFKLSPNTVRAASKRIEKVQVFDLVLQGGASPMPIGPFAADCFQKAALGAYRHFHGTFRNLDLPCWKITDGVNTIDIMDLRKLDTDK